MKNTPLSVEVIDGELIIKIGTGTIAFSARHNQETGIEVTNADGFAKDVVRALEQDNEIGETLLTDCFDQAINDAAESGSEYVNFIT